MGFSRSLLVSAVLALLVPGEVGAADQPVSARKLILRRTAAGEEKLLFLAKDPQLLIPDIGSADDPASGTPGGITIELFSQNEGVGTLLVPPAVGWLVRDGSPATFKFVNKLAPDGVSPVFSLLLKKGRAIRIRAFGVGLPLAGRQGAIGIRITMGSTRNCALFDASTIRHDGSHLFFGRDADGTSIPDCSNTSLGGPTCVDSFDAPTCGGTCLDGSACGTRDLTTCQCIDAAQPCGDTWPVCNGECPAGQECGSVGGFPLPTCGCLPAGTVACGDTFPVCGGTCPAGLTCYANSIGLPIGNFDFCECLAQPPVDPCGGCPVGSFCIGPPIFQTPSCVPTACGGTYPTCGDPGCPTGSTCQAIAATGTCGCLP
ncbi:MAG TPA: hypothetical protein VMS22_17435 [Candidatus Eisenbacteria bacterium]|nr:hypothetical protein [Candidatus Eisenbacteria bacterium]